MAWGYDIYISFGDHQQYDDDDDDDDDDDGQMGLETLPLLSQFMAILGQGTS